MKKFLIKKYVYVVAFFGLAFGLFCGLGGGAQQVHAIVLNDGVNARVIDEKNILDVKTMDDDVVMLAIDSNRKAPAEKRELIEKRTMTSQHFGDQIKIYTSAQFVKAGKEWNFIDYATTTQDKIIGLKKPKKFDIFEIKKAVASDEFPGQGGDGYALSALSSAFSFEDVRVATTTTGGTVSGGFWLGTRQTAGGDKSMYRAFVVFDTTNIASYDVVASGSICVHITTKNDNDGMYVGFVSRDVPNMTSYVDSFSLSAFGGSFLTNTRAVAGFTINNTYCFSLSSEGLEYIDKNNWTDFGFLTEYDLTGSPELGLNRNNLTIYGSGDSPFPAVRPYMLLDIEEGEPPTPPTPPAGYMTYLDPTLGYIVDMLLILFLSFFATGITLFLFGKLVKILSNGDKI